MTTADHRRGGACGAALRWTGAAVIALVAALVVLVHHETAVTITHVPPARASETSSLTGMHDKATPAMPVHASGHAMSSAVTAATASDDDGACSGTMTQHCSAAGVDSMKLAPPQQPCIGCAPAICPGGAAGRSVPRTTGRAPPDLSLLSRFLL